MGKDGKRPERAWEFTGRAAERPGKRQGMRCQVAIAAMTREIDKRPKRSGSVGRLPSFAPRYDARDTKQASAARLREFEQAIAREFRIGDQRFPAIDERRQARPCCRMRANHAAKTIENRVGSSGTRR